MKKVSWDLRSNIPLKRFLPDFSQKSVLNQYVPSGTGLPKLITKNGNKKK